MTKQNDNVNSYKENLINNNQTTLISNGFKKTSSIINNNQINNQINNHNFVFRPPRSNRSNKSNDRSTGVSLCLKERKLINIDSICHLNWMLIILIFTLINIYNFTYLDDKCKDHKLFLISLSRLISSLSAIETTCFYLIWFFLTNSKYYYKQIIYDTIISIHIIVAFINILYAIIVFLTRTCHEQKLTNDTDFKFLNDKLSLLALKYDLKIASCGHLLLVIIIAFSAIHLSTKRSKYKLLLLHKRGLLTEYLWEFEGVVS